MAILVDPEGVITVTSDEQTEWVLRHLHRGRQFRTDPEDREQDQYRETLRCIISRTHSNITAIGEIFHDGITAGRDIPCIPKGGETTINVKVGTGGDGQFGPWQLTDQSFDELQQDGSLLYTETREYMSVSGDSTSTTAEMWEDFNWFEAE